MWGGFHYGGVYFPAHRSGIEFIRGCSYLFLRLDELAGPEDRTWETSLPLAQAQPVAGTSPDETIAAAYNLAGARYAAYADGASGDLFAFDGHYAFGDRATWYVIDKALRQLRADGTRALRLLDLGCGPGLWLRRTVTRAAELGFEHITARGLDLATDQIARARALGGELARRYNVVLRYDVCDICDPIPEPDGSVDLCLCLYGVLNHVPVGHQPQVLGEIARVTRGRFIATVRAIGSTPTIYVDSIAAARDFVQDNREDKMHVALSDGRQLSFDSHLFASAELEELTARWFAIDELRGLDLFHGRFAEDKRFNPPSAEPSAGLLRELEQLEARYCHDPKFIDHATHLLLVARPRQEND